MAMTSCIDRMVMLFKQKNTDKDVRDSCLQLIDEFIGRGGEISKRFTLQILEHSFMTNDDRLLKKIEKMGHVTPRLIRSCFRKIVSMAMRNDNIAFVECALKYDAHVLNLKWNTPDNYVIFKQIFSDFFKSSGPTWGEGIGRKLFDLLMTSTNGVYDIKMAKTSNPSWATPLPFCLVAMFSNRNMTKEDYDYVFQTLNIDLHEKVNGATPLMYAAHNNRINTNSLEYLLEQGVDPNIQGDQPNYFGYTALHYAVQHRHKCNSKNNLKMATLLMKYGADPNIKNNMGQTSYDMVCKDLIIRKGVKKAIVALKDYGFLKPNVSKLLDETVMCHIDDTTYRITPHSGKTPICDVVSLCPAQHEEFSNVKYIYKDEKLIVDIPNGKTLTI